MKARIAAFCVLFLCACAPRAFVLIPAPPVEVRKEKAAPAAEAVRMPPPSAAPADNAVKPAAPPPPAHDPARYAAAIARTKEAISRGTPKDAVAAWKVLEGGPWNADAVFNQGVLLQLGGDLDGARDRYRRVTDNTPVHEAAAANLLGLYQIRGDAAAARALVSRVRRDGSAPSAAMLPQLKSNIAGWLVETGDLDGAGRLLDDLRARGEGGPAVSWNSAVLSFRKGDVAGARRFASTIPAGMGSLWSVAASRYAWERDGEKIPMLANVPETEPVMAALARNLSAYSEFAKGNPAGTERILARGGDCDDCPAELQTNLGISRAEQGKWKEARAALEKAVKKKPDLPEAWLNLGIFRDVYEGDAAGAVDCYRNYVKYNGLRKEEVGKWIDWLQKSPPQP